MRLLFWCLLIATVFTLPVTELFRSVIHKRRERVQGMGGTQDIAMIGTLVFLILTVATIVTAIVGDVFPRQ